MMSEDGHALRSGGRGRRRRRRPSGEPPPLVRGIGWQRWAWGLLAVVLFGVVLADRRSDGGRDRPRPGGRRRRGRSADAGTRRRREGRGPPHRRPVDHGPAMGNGPRTRGPRALPAPRRVPRDVRGHGLGGRPGAPRGAGAPRCDGARRGRNLRVPVPVDRGARDHPRRYRARARPTRSRPADRRRGSCTGRSSRSFSPS